MATPGPPPLRSSSGTHHGGPQRGEHDRPEANQPSRDKLKEVGVWTGLKVYKDGKHGCWNRLPWFDDMVLDMDRFFREHMK